MRERRISNTEFERLAPTLKDKIRRARQVHAWKPGEGWKILLEYPFQVDLPNGGFFTSETSEGCILQSLSALLGKDRLHRLYQKAFPMNRPTG
jgi:hypothetical protein